MTPAQKAGAPGRPSDFELNAFIGGGKAINALKAALAAGSLPHAVLLCAPDGCGRNYAARLLAADYLSSNFAAIRQGGDVVAAKMLHTAAGGELITVQGEGKSGRIPVERVREMRAAAHLSALSAAGRVVHIRNAHFMTPPAAGALLKILEEPPDGVFFILTAESPAVLPATIVSRCALYTLAVLERAACCAALADALPAGADPGLPALITAVYEGRIGLGLRVLTGEGRLDIMNDALNVAKAAALRNAYGMLTVFSRYEGRLDGERERRESLLADLSAVLAASVRAAALLYGEVPQLLHIPAAGLFLPFVEEARLALVANAAPKITFAALAVRLAQAGLPGQTTAAETA